MSGAWVQLTQTALVCPYTLTQRMVPDTLLAGEAREGGLRTEHFLQEKQTINEQDKLNHRVLVKIKLTISLVFSLIIR